MNFKYTLTFIWLLAVLPVKPQIHLPLLNDDLAGIKAMQTGNNTNVLSHTLQTDEQQWYTLPSPSGGSVTQAGIACDGSDMVIFYRQPDNSLNIDEGIVQSWTGSNWAMYAAVTNQCHNPDIDIDGSVMVATWFTDGYDYGYGTNINGPWVSLSGTYLNNQWFPRATMAMNLPYMSFTCKYSDGMPSSYDMLHIKSIVGTGDRIELNGGWSVPFTSVGLNTDITGDDEAWYCVFSQQQFLYVMKGAVGGSEPGYTDLGEGFRMYNPVSNPEISLYEGSPVVGWFENANTEVYIAQWNGSEWIVIGAGSVSTGSLHSLRMAVSSSDLYVAYGILDADTAVSVNRWDGSQWYSLPVVQDYWNPEIGTIDIAVHENEPVVAFTQNNQLIVKKFTTEAINAAREFLTQQPFGCYPNPFEENLIIKYELDKPGHISLEVYDLSGKLIDVLKSTAQSPGKYSVTWKPDNIKKGLYFIRAGLDENIFWDRVLYY